MPNNPHAGTDPLSGPMAALESLESDLLVELQDRALEIPNVQRVARGLSHFGEHAIGWMGLAAVGAGVDKRRRRQWVALGAAALSSHAISVALKRVVRRTRPSDPRIIVGVATPSRLSFPSSHSTSTTAAMVALTHLTGSRLPLLGAPIMMSSRMVLGVHYPTDTLVGAAIGALTARACMEIERTTR